MAEIWGVGYRGEDPKNCTDLYIGDTSRRATAATHPAPCQSTNAPHRADGSVSDTHGFGLFTARVERTGRVREGKEEEAGERAGQGSLMKEGVNR